VDDNKTPYSRLDKHLHIQLKQMHRQLLDHIFSDNIRVFIV